MTNPILALVPKSNWLTILAQEKSACKMSLLRYRWKRRCAQITSFLSMSIFIKFWGRENNTFFCVEERGVASIYFICLQVHLRNKTFNGLRMNKKVWASCTIFFLDGSWKGKLLTLKWFHFQEPLRASSFHVKLFFRETFSNSRTTNWFLLPERKYIASDSFAE